MSPVTHYYPGLEQAIAWIKRERLAIAAESFIREDGWAIATSCCAPPGEGTGILICRVECVRHKLTARSLQLGWHHRGK